jgi:hypothetical protein
VLHGWPGASHINARLDIAHHRELDSRTLVPLGRIRVDADVHAVGAVVSEEPHHVLQGLRWIVGHKRAGPCETRQAAARRRRGHLHHARLDRVVGMNGCVDRPGP